MKPKVLYLLPLRPKDPKALSLALERLIKNDEEGIRIGEEGYRRYLSEFTLEKMVEKTKLCYINLLNSSK